MNIYIYIYLYIYIYISLYTYIYIYNSYMFVLFLFVVAFGKVSGVLPRQGWSEQTWAKMLSLLSSMMRRPISLPWVGIVFPPNFFALKFVNLNLKNNRCQLSRGLAPRSFLSQLQRLLIPFAVSTQTASQSGPCIRFLPQMRWSTPEGGVWNA